MMQAKDIRDIDLLTTIQRLSFRVDYPWHEENKPHWVMRWTLEEEFPDIPPKVVVAKVAKLIKRGLMDGCTCGCRGDFELTEAGRTLAQAGRG